MSLSLEREAVLRNREHLLDKLVTTHDMDEAWNPEEALPDTLEEYERACYAVLETSSGPFWVTVFETVEEAFAYYRSDDSSFEPWLLYDLDTGTARQVQVNYSLAPVDPEEAL